jgi:hypothetical protein
MADEEIDELLQEMFGGGGDTMIDKVRALWRGKGGLLAGTAGVCSILPGH